MEVLPDGSYNLMGSGYLLTNCPWHDDSKRSLLVYPDGWWHCLGECQTSGPNHRLYSEFSSPGSTRRGSRDVARGYPPNVPSNISDQILFVEEAKATIQRNSSFRWYSEQRGVEGRIETCELGWHEGWLVLPIYSPERDLTGIIMRSGPQAQKLTGTRFTQPTGQRAMIYCPDWSLLDRSDQIYVVYGMIDALTLSELRLPVVTTTGGAKSFKPEWLTSYRKPIIVVPDLGELAQARKLAGRLGWRGKVGQLSYPNDFKDPNDYLQYGRGKDLLYELGNMG